MHAPSLKLQMGTMMTVVISVLVAPLWPGFCLTSHWHSLCISLHAPLAPSPLPGSLWCSGLPKRGQASPQLELQGTLCPNMTSASRILPSLGTPFLFLCRSWASATAPLSWKHAPLSLLEAIPSCGRWSPAAPQCPLDCDECHLLSSAEL